MFNIITPFARKENFDNLKNHLKPKGIKWHVITDSDSNIEINITEDWIFHYKCPNNQSEFYERCNFAINWFIEITDLNHEEYYGILNDDDGYEEFFFEKIKFFLNHSFEEDNNLLICSMKRGNNIPLEAIPIRKHGTWTLHARPEYMSVGNVGVEQFFIKGKLLKNHRLPLTVCGDGELVCELVNTYNPVYLPDVFVLFNYFEPNRWNK